MRLEVYGAVSTALTALVLSHTYETHSGSFFASAVHLSRSNFSLLIFLNQALFLTIITGRLLQRAFFGQLRAVEVEHLYEKGWFAVTETCLAMTVFRDDFDASFLAAFGSLLFFKTFHWLLQDRIEFMDSRPDHSILFHIRTASLLLLLTSIDISHCMYAMWSLHHTGPSSWILFAFEYLILLDSLVGMLGRYALNCIEAHRTDPWEEKGVYIFYLELIVDFLRLIAYLCFFFVLVTRYGLPLHILRDLYLVIRSFLRRLRDLARYRQATRDMELRYPTLTAQDLANGERICVVCREEIQPMVEGMPEGDRGKRLPCGHRFHFRCLRSWLERQQSCPTCRRSVLQDPPPAPTPNVQVQAQAAAAAAA
ncbi:MAG: hypothetical protein DHS80DRAFT_14110, partial [Piptocephalis tieghemiana]